MKVNTENTDSTLWMWTIIQPLLEVTMKMNDKDCQRKTNHTGLYTPSVGTGLKHIFHFFHISGVNCHQLHIMLKLDKSISMVKVKRLIAQPSNQIGYNKDWSDMCLLSLLHKSIKEREKMASSKWGSSETYLTPATRCCT